MPRKESNLPLQITPLIGREKELKQAFGLLSSEGTRLVTFTGAGGSGKTSLSIEVARGLIDRFSGGVFFVSLSAVTNSDLVIPTIAATLGVKETYLGTTRPIDNLKGLLYNKQILLLLDNFEQVVEAAPQLADLLASCPGLKLLVTSRETLRLNGEREFPVAPLPVPDLKHLPPLKTLSENEAVSLFVERACFVKPVFRLTESNATAVGEICVRLDGLPLALELAAARTKILSPRTILQRLDNRLRLLTGGARDLPARQRTLRAEIAWSYDLLDEMEKKLFQRLSVFAGGFNLEAAEAVCNATNDLSVDMVDGVSALVNRSLLKHEVEEGPRFGFLETIREFASECLSSSPDCKPIERAHADFFTNFAE